MGDAEKGKDDDKKEFNLLYADEYILTEIEKKFILACEHGDVSTVKRLGLLFSPKIFKNSKNILF